MFLWLFLMLHWIYCDIVYLCSFGSSSCCIGLIVTLFIWVIMVLIMLLWIYCDIVYLCSQVSSSCCIGLILTLFISVLMVLPHVALNWLWHCLSVFLWIFLMLPLIDCDNNYLCSYGSSSFCIGLIVTLFICLSVSPRYLHVALDWLWHFCVYSFDASSCFIGWIVTLCVCSIVYLCSYDSTSSCLRLIATLYIWVHMVFPHVAFDWLCYCLSVFPWFFPMLYWIDCDIVYLCSHDSFSCCFGLILTLFICVFESHSHVALDWLWHCLSMFSWLFLILHWINCVIVYLCFHGSSSGCIGFIVKLFICVSMVLPNVALDWLWHCLSVFSWFFLILHWIYCDIVYLCFYGSSHVALDWLWIRFFCVFMVLRHVAFDLLWHCLSLFSWFFLMLHWIDCDIVYLCSRGSFTYFIGLIVTLFICVLMVLSHVALDWLWHCLSVFLWVFLMLH